uniref:Uncharacterized protein n=1 Tax=Arundo donax TaxID=35708 RepID=A0A0A9H6Y6_ARUDO
MKELEPESPVTQVQNFTCKSSFMIFFFGPHVLTAL